MIAKYWKKVGIVILIIACIINIGYKIIKSTPLKKELKYITDALEKNGTYKKEEKNYNSLYEQMQNEELEDLSYEDEDE